MWFVYIIECKDGKLYTGITNNLENRIRQHNRGRGCKFTKYRIPVKLLYREKCVTKSKALRREAAIKSLAREKKLEIISAVS
ncbi:MAG: GIY-YIG nuclease family protein [Candidatus Omnitrophota bacterium]|nr:GIY-YIG nuclease family protein [Candidatus Omnitrophota bacterium]